MLPTGSRSALLDSRWSMNLIERVRLTSVWLGALLVAAMWANDFVDGTPSFAGLGVLMVWLLAQRRWAPRWFTRIVVVTTPLFVLPAYAIADTAVSYAVGTAHPTHSSWGCAFGEPTNLDPDYRAFAQWNQTSGPDAGATLLAAVRLATFRTLFAAVGPMPHAYLGPYPPELSARAALEEHGQVLSREVWRGGDFFVSGRRVRLDAHTVAQVTMPRSAVPTIRVAVVEGSCLAVGIETDTKFEVHLIDLDGFGWFAKYRLRRALPE
jgi:hypothetical protein